MHVVREQERCAESCSRIGPVDLTEGTLGNSYNTIPTGEIRLQISITHNLTLHPHHQLRITSTRRVSSTQTSSLCPSSQRPPSLTLMVSLPSGVPTLPSTLARSATREQGSLTPRDRFLTPTHSPLTSTSPASEYWGIDESITYGSETILSSTAGIVDTGTTLILIATGTNVFLADCYPELTYPPQTRMTSTSLPSVLLRMRAPVSCACPARSTAASSPCTSTLAAYASPYPHRLHYRRANAGYILQESYELTANAQIWPVSVPFYSCSLLRARLLMTTLFPAEVAQQCHWRQLG